MANEHQPITEITLPTHHPAVRGTKAGDQVKLIARRAPEPEPVMPEDRATPKNMRPAPVTSKFHVMEIKSHKAGNMAAEEPEEEAEVKPTQRHIDTPMDRVKAKRKAGKSGPPTTTSRGALLPNSAGGVGGVNSLY